MSPIEALLRIVETYCEATSVAEATLSSRVFFDGKRIADIRRGSDMGVRRLEKAMLWFSQNWPEGATWPEDVPRPSAIAEPAA